MLIHVFSLFAAHDDPPVFHILRIHVMHIPGRGDRFLKLSAEFNDPASDLLQILQALNGFLIFVFYQIPVVFRRLDLQIIIKGDQAGQFFFRDTGKQPLKDFSFGTAGAHQYALPVPVDKALGELGLILDILQMRSGYQPV